MNLSSVLKAGCLLWLAPTSCCSNRSGGGRIGDTCHEPVERLRRRQEKLQMEGEPLELPPSLATPFGLVLHELATNAAKYGALHTEDGRVKLSWKRGNNHRELIVVWEESGGPPVEPPAKQGFGGAMIEKSLPGATVTRDFNPSGLVCTIKIELPETHDGNGDR